MFAAEVLNTRVYKVNSDAKLHAATLKQESQRVEGGSR